MKVPINSVPALQIAASCRKNDMVFLSYKDSNPVIGAAHTRPFFNVITPQRPPPNTSDKVFGVGISEVMNIVGIQTLSP